MQQNTNKETAIIEIVNIPAAADKVSKDKMTVVGSVKSFTLLPAKREIIIISDDENRPHKKARLHSNTDDVVTEMRDFIFIEKLALGKKRGNIDASLKEQCNVELVQMNDGFDGMLRVEALSSRATDAASLTTRSYRKGSDVYPNGTNVISCTKVKSIYLTTRTLVNNNKK